MAKRATFSPVFVLGHSHCGSTLLGRMLQMNHDVLCPGELLWLDDALQKSLPCSCGVAIPDCPFWSRHLPELPTSIRDDYRTTALNAFEQLRTAENKKLVVDLSKSRVYRHRDLWDGHESRTGYVFMVRDPRALLASRLRDGGKLGHELRGHQKWEQRFERLTRRMGNRAMTIFYEDLAAKPEDVLRRLCSFLGIEFVSSMLNPSPEGHHFIHSSVSTYLKGSDAIALDERWRQELSPEQLDRINRKLKRSRLYQERYGLA